MPFINYALIARSLLLNNLTNILTLKWKRQPRGRGSGKFREEIKVNYTDILTMKIF